MKIKILALGVTLATGSLEAFAQQRHVTNSSTISTSSGSVAAKVALPELNADLKIVFGEDRRRSGLQDRVEDLERAVEDLQRHVYRTPRPIRYKEVSEWVCTTEYAGTWESQTFIGRGNTKREAQASASNQCSQFAKADRGRWQSDCKDLGCDETKVKVEIRE
jgi:hypothetical protein